MLKEFSQKYLIHLFFFFFLFKNVLIRLASAKNLVYNTQFVAWNAKTWLYTVLCKQRQYIDLYSLLTWMWSFSLGLRDCGFFFPVFQGRCWWNTFYYSWNWVNKSDCSSIWTRSSEWKWHPLSTAVENVFELSGKNRLSILLCFFYHSWNFSWT